jgi:hypothetical protein
MTNRTWLALPSRESQDASYSLPKHSLCQESISLTVTNPRNKRTGLARKWAPRRDFPSNMSLEIIISRLEDSKEDFLDTVSSSIYSYVSQQKENCVAVVEKMPWGDVTHKPNRQDPVDFCKVLFSFVRKKPYNGHELDSALTEPIVARVVECYTNCFEEHSDEISDVFFKIMVNDDVVLNSVVDMITDQIASTATKQARKHIAHLLARQIKEAASHSSGHAIRQSVSHLMSTTAGHQLALVTAKILVQIIGTHLKTIIAHFLTSAAFKKIVIVIIKKYVAAAVLSSVIHFVALQLGIASTGAVLWFIVLPIMIAILFREIKNFPSKLGREVAKIGRELQLYEQECSRSDVGEVDGRKSDSASGGRR